VVHAPDFGPVRWYKNLGDLHGGRAMKRYVAELFGTFWLVLGGCGSAVLAASFPELGIGLLGVSLAFGLTVLTMAYAFGHISGGHFKSSGWPHRPPLREQRRPAVERPPAPGVFLC
jgi:hypothetical protein